MTDLTPCTEDEISLVGTLLSSVRTRRPWKFLLLDVFASELRGGVLTTQTLTPLRTVGYKGVPEVPTTRVTPNSGNSSSTP